MTCYTMVEVEVNEDQYTKKAREKLGLENRGLSAEETIRLKKEVGILKTKAIMQRLNPKAMIQRKGDKLTITVRK